MYTQGGSFFSYIWEYFIGMDIPLKVILYTPDVDEIISY